jgi:ComF family protein
VRRAIIAMKFEDDRARVGSLGPLLTPTLSSMQPLDGVVPVPLHPQRRRERGFNQSEALARIAAVDIAPVSGDLLVRTRPTRHQVGLGADERRANVYGAFAVRAGHEVVGCRFALIDDVLTTGATIGNCAEALKAAGACFVGAITVARE